MTGERTACGAGSSPAASWAGTTPLRRRSSDGKHCASRRATNHPTSGLAATTNIVHWVTGVGWGVQYGAVASRTTRHPWARALAFGPVVWLSGYVVLPLAKVYKPLWDYDARTLGNDLSAHLVYGAVVSTAFAALTKTEP